MSNNDAISFGPRVVDEVFTVVNPGEAQQQAALNLFNADRAVQTQQLQQAQETRLRQRRTFSMARGPGPPRCRPGSASTILCESA